MTCHALRELCNGHKRTRSVLGGVTTLERGNDQWSHTPIMPMLSALIVIHKSALTLIVPIAHAERRNDQRNLKHADHAHACAQRYTRVLLQPRTVGGGLPAMLFLKRSISD